MPSHDTVEDHHHYVPFVLWVSLSLQHSIISLLACLCKNACKEIWSHSIRSLTLVPCKHNSIHSSFGDCVGTICYDVSSVCGNFCCNCEELVLKFQRHITFGIFCKCLSVIDSMCKFVHLFTYLVRAYSGNYHMWWLQRSPVFFPLDYKNLKKSSLSPEQSWKLICQKDCIISAESKGICWKRRQWATTTAYCTVQGVCVKHIRQGSRTFPGFIFVRMGVS